MTNQEAFNKVYHHLLKQNKKSGYADKDGLITCMYRYEGLKCGIGALIPDDLYDPKMEFHGVCALMEDSAVINALFAGLDIGLLSNLQGVHDIRDVEEWKQVLSQVADQFKLTVPQEDSDATLCL